jgi:hypothetical protein
MQLLFPPLDFADASLLLAIGAILLLVTAQILPSFNELAESTIDKKRLDIAATVSGAMFLAIVVFRVVIIILEA